MNKQILIIFVLIIGFAGISSAAVSVTSYGIYTGSDTETVTWDNASVNAKCNFMYTFKLYCSHSAWGNCARGHIQANGEGINRYGCCRYGNAEGYIYAIESHSISGTLFTNGNSGYADKVHCSPPCGSTGDISMHVNDRYRSYHFYNPNDEYFLSGDTCGISSVELYVNDNLYFYEDLNCNGDTYNFSIVNNTNYKLIFNDAHEYNFTVDGSDIVYDYDICIKTWYHFKESCNNLILDTEGFYIEKIGSAVHAANNFYAPSGILTISESPANNIYVSASPFSGQMGWFLDPIVNDTTYTLTNPHIAWSLKVIVQNESDGSLIDDAMVKVNQSCYCTEGYSVRQKLTTNGHADFTDMSLQDAGLFVMKTGYKILDESSTGYSAFLSGRANFSSKTWVVKLAPSWSENSSTFYEINNTVNIFFVNEDGNRTSQIVDTNSEVYLYYENNNTNEEDMTLKFQSSSTHTYFIDEQSWNIPYDEIGHKTIVNANFTPWDYSYRAVIYNSSIYGWNMTIPLTVRNATKESEQHYENLSTCLWFMYACDGKIDYRNDMNIGVHACSNNTTLMNVDIELYKDDVLLCYKNLTWADFTNADPQFYYIWSPSFNYISGSNYSIRMYGFDRTLLETDYVDCYTDDVTRKNKLTIIIKNHYGTNLDNTFIYLEEYGSIPTGINYYASFEGLNNGYYRYKAIKPDYIGTGWSDITITDSDEIVTYVLTATDSDAGAATQPQKVNDDALQNLYLIAMAGLLIFVLIGGFKYVI